MEKEMTKRKKNILLIIFIFPITIIIGMLYFVKLGGYFILNKAETGVYINDIKNSPELPNRFYEIYNMYIFSIKFTDCLDFDLSVLIKTSIFINYQNIRYHE